MWKTCHTAVKLSKVEKYSRGTTICQVPFSVATKYVLYFMVNIEDLTGMGVCLYNHFIADYQREVDSLRSSMSYLCWFETGRKIGVPGEHTTTLIDHHITSIPEKVNFSGIIHTGISGHNLIYGNKKLNPIHKTHKKKKLLFETWKYLMRSISMQTFLLSHGNKLS